jgi:hypothetical protein
MKTSLLSVYLILLLASFYPKGETPSLGSTKTWGFFAHKRINRLAVFILPSDMLYLYKKEIDYITEHAIDPDKRRYVVSTEGYRHYINLDKWAFLPQDKTDALILHSEIFAVTAKNDTLQLTGYQSIRKVKRDYILKSKAIKKLFGRDSIAVADSLMRKFFIYNIGKIQPDDPLSIPPDSLKMLFWKERFSFKDSIKSAFANDKLTQTGILPYHLLSLQKQLTDAFLDKDKLRILKLSAEMGHYLADAHVPLHTISNYDGQFTNQSGIHAFWESRLPELFADVRYDFFVGRADYIEKPREYFWNIVLESHKLANKVLQIEKEISEAYPPDKKYCIETSTNGVTLQKPCFDYAQFYHDKLDGMVEEQMRKAIFALGSSWYTAWVDSGQPDLNDLKIIDRDTRTKEAILDSFALLKADSISQNDGSMLGQDEGKN